MRAASANLRARAPMRALIAICAALSALPGCAAALSSLGPAALGAGEYAGMRAGDKATDRHTAGPHDEQAERCDTLVESAPGVEEFREHKDGAIDSRQWRLVDSGEGMRWAIVPEKMAPASGWQPKPGIAKLRFSPALAGQLEAGGDPQFLAYAPDDTQTIADSNQMTAMTEVFGPAIGTFQWHGRSYGYVLVKILPCFKPLD
ncbi:MAG TPA: hypothetical protein VMV27_06640 [Candidatus Binataceae bacterium]|nr:hypothetical protein [Candidatus Binataceae bacterium]